MEKKKVDRDSPMSAYYSRVKSPQSDPSQTVADSTLRDVWNNIQQNHVPPTILTSWAKEAFPSKMEYLAFKSRFIYSMATQSIVAHAYGFNQVHPSKWLLDRETGAIQVHAQKMDNLRANQYTPSIRLTPNLLNFAQICGSKHALVEAVQELGQNFKASKIEYDLRVQESDFNIF